VRGDDLLLEIAVSEERAHGGVEQDEQVQIDPTEIEVVPHRTGR
jgi:hypothetical protein